MDERSWLSNECSDHESPRAEEPDRGAVTLDDGVAPDDDVPVAHGHVLGLDHLSGVGGADLALRELLELVAGRPAKSVELGAVDVGVDDGKIVLDLGAQRR